MENIGALSILLAFCLTIFAIAASLVGAWKKKPFLIVSAERAVICVWGLVTVASGLLIYALMTGDYRLAYVAAHSNKAMPMIYKFSAWWGGQEGSLLMWNFILATYALVVVLQNRRKHRAIMPYVTTTMMVTQAFFLMLIAFLVPPFQVLSTGGKAIVDVGDGQGLNPLLQYWTMVIHPPTLYLGYVGYIVPFAFALGSLITRQPGDSWIFTTRRWAIVTWLFQSTGILLGAGWAYSVLGWGGYWGWDPVENASFLPWLTSTAFLHSVTMQEKKGMMKVWNLVLVASTFFLCIFGTFLTRSGIVSSVHAFAQSPIGPYFVAFLTVTIAITILLILSRLDYLKSEAPLESVVSRESSFLFNNLILLASCFAILWGTLFPVISEAIAGEKISVDAPWFNRVNVPIGLALLFLTGVGPLLAWRRSTPDNLKRNFLWPTIGMVATIAGLMAFGISHFYALLSLGLCTFVTWTIVSEFWKGTMAIRQKDGLSFVPAVIELTHRNTRRYGGYIVHMGIVMMFIGFSGAAFNQDTTVEVKVGDKFPLGRYEIKVSDIKMGQNENYIWQNAIVEATVDGKPFATLTPERRIYEKSQQPVSMVAIKRQLNEDLYINFAGMGSESQRPTIQAYVFPLVSWIWAGYWVLLFGSLICLVPAKVKMQYARTEVVGVSTKHVPATK
ncbi:MAG: heme lyase CcmF/NrfE family subunit [Acidobacteriota bacterium]|jgi:cytochrome c-type biogenesis protein CcmF|nr:heme lyase CcmF/NrfE family subunit [Bryobacteraceae bacterium CoA2 C42]